MLNSLPIRLLWHSFNWLTRLAIVMSAIMAVFVALLIILLRYWILPDIGQYHDRITASLSGAIGSPVTIGRIEGDWQGFQPHLNFFDVRILDEQQQPALVLPLVDSNVSWMSLLTAELRLASLEIDRPELLIRRDAQGHLFIGGVGLSKQGGDNNLADWLLRQSRIVVRNALIVWVDEQRNAPPLVLQDVNLRIESLFSHHRFALRALPPEELATPLDVRGDFRGASFDDLKDWRGQIFTQIDFTDVTAWRPWLDLPGIFCRGRGALRGWLGIEGGRVIGITADVALYDVVTKLADDVPEMRVFSLRGRAAWHEVEGGLEISTRRLAMRMQNGVELQPTDFYFLSTQQINLRPAGGVIRANLLQLDKLASLTRFLPLEAGLRLRLDAYAPRGVVSNLNAQWQGPLENPDGYKIKGRFENLAVNQVGKMPGFSGLTFDVDGNGEKGRLSINARKVIVDAPGVMREPIDFVTLTGLANWRRKGGELMIDVDNIAVANDDFAGNLYGSYQTRSGTLGVLDLTGRLTRGDVSRAARYTPLIALHQAGNDWLNGALLAGSTEDFRIRIKGNLSDFPLDGTEDVLFKIGGYAHDVVLEFDKRWPRIEKISGDFLIRGNMLEVKSPTATMAGARLKDVTVTLPDMTSQDLSLEVNGEAVAASDVFLQFIQQSPVSGYIGGVTDSMRAAGNAHLGLSLHIPLPGGHKAQAEAGMSEEPAEQAGRSRKPVKVFGTVSVQDNDIDLGGGLPVLRKTSGSLTFTESGMKAGGVQAEVLGGPAIIDVESDAGGVMHASVRGKTNFNVLRRTDPHPLLNYLHGSAAWDADISVAKKSAKVVINSDLQGISSNLPQPLAKRASEVMPLRFEKSNVLDGQDVITARLGNLLNVRLARRDEGGAMAIKRGAIYFGDQGDLSGRRKWPKKDGVWLAGTLPVLSLQGWEGLWESGGKAGEESGPSIGPSVGKPQAGLLKDAGQAAGDGMVLPIAGVNLHIEQLTGYGQNIAGLRVNAAKRGGGLAAKLSSSTLKGDVVWQPRAASTSTGSGQAASMGSGQGYDRNGKVSMHLNSLQLVKSERPASIAQPVKVTQQHLDKLPALEIAIENLQYDDKQIGRFELVGHPDGDDWRMRRLRITNPDGALMGDGIWHANNRSQVNLLLDISDAGKILERSSYPNTVKGGSGRLVANLSWGGSPNQFNYATLNGTLKLDTGKGRFLKMDPGAGKLLSILSLQSLPKRVTLDFNDVFSEGFQFDSINGNALVQDGVIDTQDFHIDGSSAKVTLKGSVDMNKETQNLRVRVLPTIGDSVSLIGVIAINPPVGIGLGIANKLFGNPLDKLVSFEYNVSGTWTDPNVAKVGKTPAKPAENNLSK